MKTSEFDVTASCQQPFSAFGEWSAFVAFRRSDLGFDVFAQAEDDEVHLVDSVSGELSVRSICEWLLKTDDVAIWGDFRDSIEVVSCIGGEDLIALAWLREHDFESAARWLLELPSECVEVIRNVLGQLDSDEVLAAVRSYLHAGGEQQPQRLFGALHGISGREEGLAALSSLNESLSVEEEESGRNASAARDRALAPFVTKIERSIDELFLRQSSKSKWSVWSSERRKIASIRQAIEAYIIEHARFPGEEELNRMLKSIT